MRQNFEAVRSDRSVFDPRLRKCGDVRWAPARPLAGGVGRPRITRYASVAQVGNELLVAGNDVQGLDPSAQIEDPLVVGRLGGAEVPPPEGDFMFAYPRLTAGGRPSAAVHVVWAEPRPGDDPGSLLTFAGLHFAALWTATYQSKEGWSLPSQIHEGPIVWGKGVELLRTGHSIHHFLIPTFHGAGAPLLHGTLADGSWRLAPVSVGELRYVAYTSLAEMSGELFAGIVAGGRGPGMSRNSVWLTSSGDEGSSWSRPVSVGGPGEYPAHDLRTRADRDGRLHMVWVQDAGDRRRMRHRTTSDRGRSWSEPSDFVAARGSLHDPQVIVDGCGRVHVVHTFMRRGGGRRSLNYVLWQDGWRDERALFPNLHGTDPSLHELDDGRLLLIFLGRPLDAPRGQPWVTYFSFGSHDDGVDA